jgi:hypothetical protein
MSVTYKPQILGYAINLFTCQQFQAWRRTILIRRLASLEEVI